MNHQLSETTSNDIDYQYKICFIFHPKWTRFLATRPFFAFVYGYLNIVQGMGFLYMVTTITSIEMHFQLPSETFGIVLSVGEVTVIVLGIVGGLLIGVNCHRPRAIGLTIFAMGIGFHLFALPCYLFGPPKPFDITQSTNVSNSDVLLCTADYSFSIQNGTLDCPPPVLKAPDLSVGGATALFLLAQLFVSFGSVALFVIGAPFLDDNVRNKNSPMYLAFVHSFRTFGPILGTVVSSVCLDIYVDPQNPPKFDQNDVRWVGAWWIGYSIMGCLAFIGALLVAPFPKHLPSKFVTPAIKMEAFTSVELEHMNKNNIEIKSEKSNKIFGGISIYEMSSKMVRILVNRLLWFLLLSQMFTVFGLEGYVIYMSKYLEQEFQMTASSAGLWTGFAFITPPMIGKLLAGFIITRFKLNARQLAFGVIIAKIIEAFGMTALLFIRCEESRVLGSGHSGPLCGLGNCDCSSATLSPVCGSDGFNYFSACHAGCSVSNFNFTQNEVYTLSNCSCISGNGIANFQLCDKKCPSKYTYLSIVAVSNFFLSIEVIAGVLFMFRCVKPEDKTIASGFVCACMGLFVFIPCPLIFSVLVDWSCKVWSKQCGRRGACDVYDMDSLRLILHLTPIICLLIGTFWNVLFWRDCKGKMSLYADEDESNNSNVRRNKIKINVQT